MSQFDYDLFVIGAGSGGVRAARIAAGHGARVAICEEYRVGGTCVIRGCVPKKLLVYASHFSEEFADAAGHGWQVGPSRFSWADLIAAKDAEIDRLNQIYISILEKAGVNLFIGRGRLLDAHTVEIGDRRVRAERILIATGGRPDLPDTPGIELAITSEQAFHLQSLPRRVLIAGGGYIAVEFAGIFNGLGSEVTLAYRRECILRGFDADVRRVTEAGMAGRGVRFLYHSTIAKIERGTSGLTVRFANGRTGEYDQVMMAIGRRPYTRDLGLESAGVATDDAGAICVDEFSRTNIENIHAVGDVTDRVALTPVALMEGHAFADSVYGGRARPVDHDAVASAVFSQPPVGTVGLSEEAARARFDAVRVFTSQFGPMKYALAKRDEKALVKLVVDETSDRVLGVHMVGPDAPEIIQGFAVAVKAGLTKADFDRTIGIHPTSAEELVTLRV